MGMIGGELQQWYRDPKRPRWINSVIVPPLMVPVSVWLATSSGWSGFYWLPLIISYLVYPIMDWYVGDDNANPPEAAVMQLESDPYYRYLTYLLVLMLFAVFFWAVWHVGTADLKWHEILGISLSMGMLGGKAINVAHELGHKKSALERTLSQLALLLVGYGHFYVAHNRCHHSKVATPEDAASARMGENLYQFALREIWGSMRQAWDFEARRLERREKRAWSAENVIIQAMLGTSILYVAVIVAFGAATLPFLAIFVGFSYFQLSMANYVEHYGLLREVASDGRYERVKPRHSWDSNKSVTNLVLFNLQRHSDHHAHPTRRYQALRHDHNAAQLPHGYAIMFLIAQIPPLWRRIIHPRLLEHVRFDFSRINIDPKKREQLLAKYASPATRDGD